MIVGSRRKQRGALRTHDSAGEKPLPPVLAQRSLLLHRELRPPATEPVSLADGGEHNEGPSETQSLRRDVRTSITGMRSGDMSAEYLPTLQPPTGAPPQHGVSALSSHASSSRSPTRPPEGVPAGREDQSWGK